MKSSNIGGQAVLEGIMMKNGSKYAVAVRKPDGEIEIKTDEYNSIVKWKKLTTIPFVRGVFNFIDSLVLGTKTLMFSASFFEEEETGVVLTKEEAEKQQKKEDMIMTITMILLMFYPKQINKELLMLFSTTYGSMMTYYYNRKGL